MKQVQAILLAAGASRRMGRAKQLLPYRNSTLLEHAVQTVLASQCQSVTVVVGANAEKIEPVLTHYPVQIVHNPEWEQGMSASIVAGMKTIAPETDGVLICLGDQPRITTAWLEQLEQAFKVGPHSVVATSYFGKPGVPVIWGQKWFSALRKLRGQAGARDLLRAAKAGALTLEFPAAALDIDSPEDYRRLIEETDRT